MRAILRDGNPKVIELRSLNTSQTHPTAKIIAQYQASSIRIRDIAMFHLILIMNVIAEAAVNAIKISENEHSRYN